MPKRSEKYQKLGFSFKEAAQALGISSSDLEAAKNRGDLRVVQFGNWRDRIPPSEFLRIRDMVTALSTNQLVAADFLAQHDTEQCERFAKVQSEMHAEWQSET